MQMALFNAPGLTPDTVLDALNKHKGQHSGISAKELVCQILNTHNAAEERKLRQIIETLRRQGYAICAHPQCGYYLANTATELDDTCRFLLGRAMTSLTQVAAMRKTAVPDLYGQFDLKL